MMTTRAAIPTFQLANPIYASARVTYYTVDDDGAKTSTKATLYDAPSGSGTLANPVKLDANGKFQTVPYITEAVIGEVTGIAVEGHDTGIVGLSGSEEEAALYAAQAEAFAHMTQVKAKAAAASAAAAAASAASIDESQIVLAAQVYL